MDHPCPQLEKAVYGAGDGDLVSRDEAAGEDHQITGLHAQVPVRVGCHPAEGRALFPLGARHDDHLPVGREIDGLSGLDHEVMGKTKRADG